VGFRGRGGIRGWSSSTECHRIRSVSSVINILPALGKDDHVFVQLRVRRELPNADVRVEVHAFVGVDAPVGACWRDVGLGSSSVDVEEGVPWVAVNGKVVTGIALWAPAVGVAALPGVLSTVHVLIPTGSPVFDLRNCTGLADIADLGGVLALVVVGDDSNQPVHGLPTLLELDGKCAVWDMFRLFVQELGDLGGQGAANLAQIPLLTVQLNGIAASTAGFRVLVEFSEALGELVIELFHDGTGGSRAGSVCLSASHGD
jgi:hypothetical protein